MSFDLLGWAAWVTDRVSEQIALQKKESRCNSSWMTQYEHSVIWKLIVPHVRATDCRCTPSVCRINWLEAGTRKEQLAKLVPLVTLLRQFCNWAGDCVRVCRNVISTLRWHYSLWVTLTWLVSKHVHSWLKHGCCVQVRRCLLKVMCVVFVLLRPVYVGAQEIARGKKTTAIFVAWEINMCKPSINVKENNNRSHRQPPPC